MTKTVTVHAQQKWEHFVLTRKSETYLTSELNVLGQEGWELVTVLYYKDLKGIMCWTAFLKRPSTGAAPPPQVAAADHAAHAPAPSPPGEDAARGFNLDGDEFKIAGESPG